MLRFPRPTEVRAGMSLFGVFLPAVLAAACASTQPSGKPPLSAAQASGTVTPAAVDDGAFAQASYRVLVGADTGGTRASLLAGVVARQLERTRMRFQSDHPETGYASLQGAFLLMRRGEFRREALLHAAPALEYGANAAARRGEEGYALAL